jgi:predicted DNA-binding transcriptional regulator AlpA
MNAINFLARRDVETQRRCGHSTLYADVAAGTFPPPVKLSARCVRWIAQEVNESLAARAAGAGPDELRTLVREQIARRAANMPRLNGAAA